MVICVAETMLVIVVPAGMPGPFTYMPTKTVAVLVKVSVFEAVAAAVSVNKGVVGTIRLPIVRLATDTIVSVLLPWVPDR
jgi:hypothetical protein